MSGGIRLIYKDREIRYAIYDGRYNRKAIIDSWRKLHPQKQMDKMFIQIIPHTNNDERVIKKQIQKAHDHPIPEEFLEALNKLD